MVGFLTIGRFVAKFQYYQYKALFGPAKYPLSKEVRFYTNSTRLFTLGP